jgi:hypothetical protein
MAMVSHKSPIGVLVAWPFTYCTSVGFRRACLKAISMQRAAPEPSGKGELRWYASALSP